jgi:hypothetical protein
MNTIGVGGWSAGIQRHNNFSVDTLRVHDGAIGAITSSPSGTALIASSGSVSTYGTGNKYIDHTINYGLNNGNHTTGIAAARFRMGLGTYQFGFTPAIPKDNTKVLSLTVRISWARKTL